MFSTTVAHGTRAVHSCYFEKGFLSVITTHRSLGCVCRILITTSPFAKPTVRISPGSYLVGVAAQAPADPEKAGGQNLYEYYAQLGGAMEVERVLTHARMLLYETQSHPVPPDLADILRDGSDVSGVDGVECAGGGVGSGGDGDVDGGGEGVGIADCASSEGTDGAQTPDTTQIGVASHVHSSGQINGDANSSTLPSACEDATAVSDITGSDCVAGDPHSEGSPTQLDGATTEPSGSKVPVLTPELLAATPSAVVNTCETAFTVDNNKDVAAALELYLAAIDGLIEHIKSFPKADPAAKIIKRFIKALLCRADYLKQTCL
eukprot:m.1152281 g.1152281  ORF g.1152281 m.1152281 type:complete len:320 (+) comp24482_c0_seq1:3274-4233(+)